jgi:hypothetical protein
LKKKPPAPFTPNRHLFKAGSDVYRQIGKVPHLEASFQSVHRRNGRVFRRASLRCRGSAKAGIIGQDDLRSDRHGVTRENNPVLSNDGVASGRVGAKGSEKLLESGWRYDDGTDAGDGSRRVMPLLAD